ncbi:MAG TPA: DUF167 domain-containing protein [Propionibacteriaceae bacterium]|nr:DUF167 domain-containing protein [Propionibacteriaceae bacterium]
MPSCGGSEGIIRARVRVKPGSSRNRVGGNYASPDGDALIVAVSAPAVDGRANDAVIKVLADALSVRRADITIIHGHLGRTKVVDVPDVCQATWERLLTS